MKLYMISQNENSKYDTYDSAVVAAETEDKARNILPSGYEDGFGGLYSTWCSSPDKVKVEYLGEAKEGTKPGVICSSFNAG